jgi:hypothetical protein
MRPTGRFVTQEQVADGEPSAWIFKGSDSEFCSYDWNVEAASPAEVDAPVPPPGADVGNAPHSGSALSFGLARSYPPLIFSPQSLSFCF